MFVTLAMPVVDNTMRVASQVVSGIGFLGAGVIMREGLTEGGLNTAGTCGAQRRKAAGCFSHGVRFRTPGLACVHSVGTRFLDSMRRQRALGGSEASRYGGKIAGVQLGWSLEYGVSRDVLQWPGWPGSL